MNKIKLYWEFYKSTLFANLLFSVVISLIVFPLFFTILPIVIMTGGPVLSLFYKEISQKNEYYFYYNRGISKISLILSNMFLNVLTGLILLFVIVNV
jgi:hypothetical protein